MLRMYLYLVWTVFFTARSVAAIVAKDKLLSSSQPVESDLFFALSGLLYSRGSMHLLQ